MRQYITAEARMNELRMLINKGKYKKKLFILLEGTTDIRIFRRLLNIEKIVIDSMDGKSNLERIVQTLAHEFKGRIVAVCDADYDHLSGKGYTSSLMLPTDTHDIETMMLNSPALNAVISEYATVEFFEGLQRQLLKIALDIGYDIGLLRWINHEETLYLSFKSLDFDQFVKVDGLSAVCDRNLLIKSLIAGSKRPKTDPQYLLHKLEVYRSKKADPWQVCAGHDLAKIMALILSQGQVGLSDIEAQQFESSLRVSYQAQYFRETQLAEKIIKWAGQSGLEQPLTI